MTSITLYPPVPTEKYPITKHGESLPGSPGVYFIWGCSSQKVEYVGKSRKLSDRVNTKHFAAEAKDTVSWLSFPVADLVFAEAYYIGVLKPPRNFSGFIKSRDRSHVSVRPEVRNNGRRYYIVTWTPLPGQRCRKTFSDKNKAEAEADKIESLLNKGYRDLGKATTRELTAIDTLLKLLPEGVSPAQVVRDWLTQNHIQQATMTATAADVCTAFLNSRSSAEDFSTRHIQTVRSHISRFSDYFNDFCITSIDHAQIKKYLDDEIGGAAKTRAGHLITIRSLFRWARDIGIGKAKYLPPGRTAADEVQTPKVDRSEHEVYSPDEFMRLLVFTPANMVMFMVLGQFAGIRAEERTRLLWQHWREQEDGKIVLNGDVTKTGRRRRVDVHDNLARWMSRFRTNPSDFMVAASKPHSQTSRIADAAKIPWKDNALRAGYASYHLELFDNAALTAKNDGHSVTELERTYKSISGVTKQTATQMFSITPEAVIEFAKRMNLPKPLWS